MVRCLRVILTLLERKCTRVPGRERGHRTTFHVTVGGSGQQNASCFRSVMLAASFGAEYRDVNLPSFNRSDFRPRDHLSTTPL